MVAEEDAEDQCPLCPPSGPPLRTRGDSLDLLAAAATETNLDDTPDFIWISCSKCRTWYHSVCLLLADDDGTRWTVPSDVRDEIATKHRDEGPWTNWVGWVDRWYACWYCPPYQADLCQVLLRLYISVDGPEAEE